MKITAGPMIVRYATVFGIPAEEVVTWIQGYVNHPEEYASMVNYEATEKERFESMKAYIQWRLDNSTDGRIKSDIKASHQEAA